MASDGSSTIRDLERMLACFTDEDGCALAEEDQSARPWNAFRRVGAGGLTFGYGDSLVPVLAITSDAVPARFGFVQTARAARRRGSLFIEAVTGNE